VILTVTPNPCVDKTVFIDTLEVGAFMRSSRYTCIPGGKGTNVSRAVHAMGRPTRAFVVVGGHTGAHVVDMIEHDDRVECVPCWVQSPTRTITTVLEEAVHRQTAFFEPGSQVTPDEGEAIVERFLLSLEGVRLVTFNGTVSDRSIQHLYARLITAAKARGLITILDSHGPEFAQGVESGPYMVKPNVAETEEWLGCRLDTDDAKWQAIERFHQKGVELVVLSLGKHGALVSRGGMRLHAVPPVIEEINPVGSGDALVAGFAIGLTEDMPLEAMASLGVAMGAANAMSWDIGHLTRADVEGLLPHVQPMPASP
jgi:tagatose 6-phosphate kinase